MKLLIIASLSILLSCSHTEKLKDKIVVAHRGASGYLPEHSLEGVGLSHSWGVDYIEADVVLTKDDVPVVLHDIHLDTTTNVADVFPKRVRSDGRYYAIDFTVDEIKSLSLKERVDLKTGKRVYPNRFSGDSSKMRVPRLEEFILFIQGLNTTSGKETGVYVEIKSPEFHLKNKKDITKITLNILKEYDYDTDNSRAIIQCFYPPTLKRLKTEFNTKIPLVLLLADNSWKESSIDYDHYLNGTGLAEIKPYIDGVGPWIPQLKSSKILELSKLHKLKVHAYTHRIDSLPKGYSSDELLKFLFIDSEIDGVFTDFGDKVMKYLKND